MNINLVSFSERLSESTVDIFGLEKFDSQFDSAMDPSTNEIETDVNEYVYVHEHDTLRYELNAMRLKKEFTNITIKVGTQEFPAHRSVLAAQVEFFKMMFTTNFDESGKDEAVVGEQFVSASVFEDILEFVYLGRIRLTRQNCQSICQAAHYLKLAPLVEVTEQYLVSGITSENFFDVFEFAKKFKLTSLLNKMKLIVFKSLDTPKTVLTKPTKTTSCLFFIGGESIDRANAVFSVSKWNPNTKQLTQVASMITPRFGAKAAVIGSKIYVFGGEDGEKRLKSLEVYDTRTNRWIYGASMSTENAKLEVATLDGHVYVWASDGNSFERYDPASNKWTKLAPPGQFTVAYKLVACLGMLYAIHANAMEHYNPNTDSWEDVSSFAEKFSHIYSSVVFNDRIYVLTSNCLYEFNPENRKWLVFAEFQVKISTKKMAVIEDRLLLVGEAEHSKYETWIYEFNFVSKMWKLFDEFELDFDSYEIVAAPNRHNY